MEVSFSDLLTRIPRGPFRLGFHAKIIPAFLIFFISST
jgi:hypothetical protein